MHSVQRVILITGARKGIGKYLAHYYSDKGHQVIGCSRKSVNVEFDNYQHFCLDVCDEKSVLNLFSEIRRKYSHLDILINNAGIAAMNHALLTPLSVAQKIMDTNVISSFLFCREAAKLMSKNKFGRIVNFTTIAVPLKVEGEAIYASSKAAIVTMTEILGKEFAEYGITVNAIGPTPIETDLIRAVPQDKIQQLLNQQSIHRLGALQDISNVIDFYISSQSDFITGQTIFLGGVS
ncbi:MAG: SDR family oxidoreductase [Pseudomonadota bacterium]